MLELMVGRVKDKSSLVRKSAVHLLSAFLTGNPFSSKVRNQPLPYTYTRGCTYCMYIRCGRPFV